MITSAASCVVRRRVKFRHLPLICIAALSLVTGEALAQSYGWLSNLTNNLYATPDAACAASNRSQLCNIFFTCTFVDQVNYALGVIGGSLATNNATYACSATLTVTGSPANCQAQGPGYCSVFFISTDADVSETATNTIPPSPPLYFVMAPVPQLGECQTCDPVGEPINPATGNVYIAEEDVKFASPSPIAYRRFYNSADPYGADQVPGWRHSYSRTIKTVYQSSPNLAWSGQSATVSNDYATQQAACTSGFTDIQAAVPAWSGATVSFAGGVCSVYGSSGVLIATLQIYSFPIAPFSTNIIEYDLIRDDGQVLRYATVNGGAVISPPGISIRLAITSSGFTVTDDDDNVEIYNSAGLLQSITSRSGIVQTIVNDSNGRFNKVTDNFGNTLSVTRNAANSVATMSAGGNTVQYSYNGTATLSGVINADGTTRAYAYTDAAYPNALTGVVDESTKTFASYGYDSQERGNSTQEYGGANAHSLMYNSNGSVTDTDALGAMRTFTYTRVGDINKVTSISGSQCPTCLEPAATTYDSYGWVASRTDYNGNLTCYSNDPVRGLELVRVEGFAPGSTCPANLSTYTLTSVQRRISTVWDPTWRLPDTITEFNRTTGYMYDGHGNVQTKTITDTTGTPNCLHPNCTRIWTYVYYNNGLYGQVNTLTGPRTDINTDVTTYAFNNCTTGGPCGQLATVKDAAGHFTTYLTYNNYGQPLTLTDPNGVLTTLTYDTRERLLSSQVGVETTSYSYYPIGLLDQVTRPDMSTVVYTYDGAHRLTTITDGPGNYISYTLDAMGNHTFEYSYDPTGALHRKHTAMFNALSQRVQDTSWVGTPAVAATTVLTYYPNGELETSDAPQAAQNQPRNTELYYDNLNRLNQITDPKNGNTYLNYDADDNLTSVQDPLTFTTSYTRDGFNEVSQLVSPDTGTTSPIKYDSAGNLYQTTDARGALATYSYDELNRETKVVYSDQTINLSYDTGTNGLGRLTGASDAYHSMSWGYDTHGRVTSKSQTITALSVTKSVGYTYIGGDLVSLVTPYSQKITYGYINHSINWITVNGTTLLYGGTVVNGTTQNNGMAYEPFGPVNAWMWGNGTSVSRTYDESGSPALIVTAGVTNTYTPDPGQRITTIQDGGLSSNTWNFAYDALDRVTGASSTAFTRGYTYDANGNMNGQSGPISYTAQIGPSNNRIASTTGGLARTYSYFPAGEVQGYGSNSYTFNQRDRMSSAIITGAGTTNYVYNAVGQLIEKSGYGGTTLLMYDEAGHILGEYTNSGAPIEETVWLGDLPVATLQPSGSSISIYYIHSDHLGTPRKITQPSSNTLAWRWDPDAYGAPGPNQNPGGLGTFVYNLRFPGQYYLAETGLYNNYFRDYDPIVGSYMESDPLGLRTDLNTYGYAGNDPLGFTDRYGLCRVDLHFSRLGPGYYHAYLVTTDPNGAQTYFRGGPSAGGPSSGVSGILGSASSGSASGWSGSRRSNSSGGSGNGSSPGSSAGGPGQNNGPWGPIITDTGLYVPGSIDYQTGDTPVTILNNSEPCTCTNNNFAQTLRSIQDAQIPYNPLSTNSNATARDLIQQDGLPVPIPPVWVPGWSTPLKH
jgi:RHS repeat-associated protein